MIPSTPKLILKLFNLFSDKISDGKSSKTILDLKKDDCMNMTKQLQASLKQLEFISYFEMHIDKRKEDSYSLGFLQELERIKHDSQTNIIELIKYQKQ